MKKVKSSTLANMILSADAHFDIANAYFQTMKEDGANLPIIPNDWVWEMSHCIAAGTNLSLAVELYLKSLNYQSSGDFLRIHDLDELYDKVDNRQRQNIEMEYLRYDPASENAFHKVSRLTFQRKKKRGGFAKHDDKIEGYCRVRPVLTRAARSFVELRYAFDTFDARHEVQIEYGALWCIARSVRMCLVTPCFKIGAKNEFAQSPFAVGSDAIRKRAWNFQG